MTTTQHFETPEAGSPAAQSGPVPPLIHPPASRLLRVKDWDTRFESAKSRTYKLKSQAYMPNKVGIGYMRLMREPDGAALYGAWCAVICLLSRMECPRHGYLTDTGRASGKVLDAATIAMLTMIPEPVVENMLKLCSSKAVAWLEVAYAKDTAKDTTGIPQYPCQGYSPLPLPSPLPVRSTHNTRAKTETFDADGIRIEVPTLEAVLENAARIGMHEADAKEFLAYWHNAGWRDRNGTPLRNWKAAMASRKTDLENEKAKEKHANGRRKNDPNSPAVHQRAATFHRGNPSDYTPEKCGF